MHCSPWRGERAKSSRHLTIGKPPARFGDHQQTTRVRVGAIADVIGSHICRIGPQKTESCHSASIGELVHPSFNCHSLMDAPRSQPYVLRHLDGACLYPPMVLCAPKYRRA